MTRLLNNKWPDLLALAGIGLVFYGGMGALP